MRVSILFYLISFVLILVLLFVVTQRLATSEAEIRAVDVVGTVEVQRKGATDWKPLRLGALVKSGDTVRTGDKAEVNMAWTGGTHVRLDPNTEFKIILAETENKSKRTSTDASLLKGKAWIKLRKSLEESLQFQIDTPAILAFVVGTIFSIEVEPDGTTRLETFEGEVGVNQGKQGSLVSDKSIAVYYPSGEYEGPTSMNEDQYKAWMAKWSVIGAFLSVQSPKEGEKVSSPLLTVSGYAEPGNTVEVNGVFVIPNAEGRWTARATVKPGENQITIQSIDADGRQRIIVRKVVYES